MEWVAIDVHIGGNAVTHRLAEAFKLRVAEAAGLLTLTLAGMASNAVDGDLADVPNSQIESWAQWHGKRGKFAEFFRAQMCDADGVVIEWEDYNGASMRAAESSRERSRRWRDVRRREREARDLEALRLAEETANGTPERTPFVTHTELAANASTGQDTTGPSIPVVEEHVTEHGGTEIAEAAFRAAMGSHIRPVDDFLAKRPAEHRANWYPELLRIIGPATGVLPEDLAGGCSDAMLVDPPAKTPVALRAFASRRKVERLKASIPAPVIRVTSSSPSSEPGEDERLWSECQDTVSNLRARKLTSEAFNALPFPLRAGLRSIGGWQAVNEAKSGSLPFLRRDFLAAYRAAEVAEGATA